MITRDTTLGATHLLVALAARCGVAVAHSGGATAPGGRGPNTPAYGYCVRTGGWQITADPAQWQLSHGDTRWVTQ